MLSNPHVDPSAQLPEPMWAQNPILPPVLQACLKNLSFPKCSREVKLLLQPPFESVPEGLTSLIQVTWSPEPHVGAFTGRQ